MTLNDRKTKLKKIAIDNYSIGTSIYILISKNNLDHIINKITDEKTYTNTRSIIKKGYLTGNEQFIDVLSETISYFNSHFLPLEHKELHFASAVENYIPKFLLCKKYWGDNKFIPYYTKNMQKLFVKNFYNNIKYIYTDFEIFFKSINITKKMSLNRTHDLNKIFNFLEELIWCNCKYNQFSMYYIFSDYKSHLKERRKQVAKKGLNANDIVYKDYCMHWHSLIREYKKNIECVKKFMSLS